MSDNPIPELKPCPFCGGEAIFGGMDFEPGDFERIECRRCDAHMTGSKADVVARWNQRAAEAALAEARQERDALSVAWDKMADNLHVKHEQLRIANEENAKLRAAEDVGKKRSARVLAAHAKSTKGQLAEAIVFEKQIIAGRLGIKSLYCSDIDNAIMTLQAQVAQLQTTISQLRNELSLVSEMANHHVEKGRELQAALEKYFGCSIHVSSSDPEHKYCRCGWAEDSPVHALAVHAEEKERKK